MFRQIPVEQFTQNFQALGDPPHIVLEMTEAMQWFNEFGCMSLLFLELREC